MDEEELTPTALYPDELDELYASDDWDDEGEVSEDFDCPLCLGSGYLEERLSDCYLCYGTGWIA